MSVRSMRPRRLARAGAGIVAFLFVLLAPCTRPLTAQGADSGWFITLDAALTQPNVDQEYAVQTDTTGFPVRNTRHTFDSDIDTSFRAGFGYGFGAGRGTLRVTYWEFDNTDGESKNLKGMIEPLVFGEGYYSPFYYLSSASGVSTEFTSDIDAITIDVDYLRSMTAGRRMRVNWLLGFRVASYDETQTFTGSDAFYVLKQEKELESDAFGVRVGAEAQFNLGRYFMLTGGLTASILQADTNGAAVQQFFDTAGGLVVAETNEANDDNLRAQILDIDVRAVWKLRYFDVFLGYQGSTWDGLVEDPLPSANGTERDTVSFNSIHAGITWRFSPRKAVP
ncbi:MAG: Lpg1974 family pore-forming outer membrane protein [Acidobacteriota bacterium]